MKSLIKKIQKIRDALNCVSADVYHYEAANKKDQYIVWSEDGEGNSLYADNGIDEQVITGTIDLFTKTEYDEIIDNIQNALEQNLISFQLYDVSYETDTEYIHYQWKFEV